MVALVLELVQRFPPLKPTGRSFKQRSASDIVAAVFTEARGRIGRGVVTGQQVRRIWFRYSPAVGLPKNPN